MSIFYNCYSSGFQPLLPLFAFLCSYGLLCGQGNEQTLEKTLIMFHTPGDFEVTTPKKYPLLVDLHGSGDVGKVNFENFRDEGPARLILAGEWPVDSFIVVVPVLNRDGKIEANNHLWPVELVDDLIDSALVKYSGKVDADRIYMSGISLGAKGVWDYAKIHPERLAAIVPIAGNSKYDDICNLIDLPVWAFHGAEDNQVWHDRQSTTQPGRYGTSLLVEKINNDCETIPTRPIRLTYLEGMKHDGFRKYYDLRFGYNIFKWMLQHTRGTTENIIPLVNAGSDLKVKAGTDLKLLGKYHDTDGTVTALWSKRSGPDVTMGGEQQSILTLSDLATGVYLLRLTVTDNQGASAYDEVQVIVTDSQSELAVTGMEIYAHFNNQMPKQLIKGLREGENNFISIQDESTSQFYLKAFINSSPDDNISLNLSMNYNASARDTRPLWFVTGPKPGSFWRLDTTWIITVTPYDDYNKTTGISAQYEVTVVEHPLPVEFLDISARPMDNGIQVRWATATETNNDFFTIERSGDTQTFTSIGKVAGAGTSKSVLQYSYSDYFALAGITYYYRVRQTDFDGRSNYSKIVSVHNTEIATVPEIQVFPNPLKQGSLTIKLFGHAPKGPLAIQLVDALGRVQYSAPVKTAFSAQGFNVSFDRPLENGVYILRVQQGQHVAQKKVIVY